MMIDWLFIKYFNVFSCKHVTPEFLIKSGRLFFLLVMKTCEMGKILCFKYLRTADFLFF